MMKKALTGMAAVLAASLFSGCGGGGGEGNTGTALGTMKNTITIASPAFKAGQSINISSRATMRGAVPTAMHWSASPLSASGAADPLVISDANCQSATFSPPLFGNDSGVGVCQTNLVAPVGAKAGKWRITNVASSAGGTISDSVEVEIFASPANGFSLVESSTPVQAFVGKMASLSMPFTVSAGSSVKNVKYQWSAAASNPETVVVVGSNSSTAKITPTSPGTYLFNVSVSADINDSPEVATGEIAVVVNTTSVVDQVSAGTSQVVGASNVVLLQGQVLNPDPTLVYRTTWRQLDGLAGGPIAVTLFNKDSYNADFISPAIAGTYAFEFRVVKTQADGSQVTTTAQTSVRVMVAAPSVFSISAGDAQHAKIGDVVSLNGSVEAGGGTGTGVTYSYSWAQVAATPAPVTMSNANSAKPTFVALTAGTYTFRLTVTATSQAGTVTVTGDTQVIVGTTAILVSNFAITADAGPVQAVATYAVARLTGAKVTQGVDTGVTYAYAWEQVGTSPAAVALSNASTSSATFFPTTPGVYTFKLTITATLPGGETRTAQSTTQVITGSVGAAFSVSAGDAQTGPANTAKVMSGIVTKQGSFDGATFAYSWTQVGASPAAVTISNANALTASFVPTVVGTYTFMLSVTLTRDGVATTQTAQVQILVI